MPWRPTHASRDGWWRCWRTPRAMAWLRPQPPACVAGVLRHGRGGIGGRCGGARDQPPPCGRGSDRSLRRRGDHRTGPGRPARRRLERWHPEPACGCSSSARSPPMHCGRGICPLGSWLTPIRRDLQHSGHRCGRPPAVLLRWPDRGRRPGRRSVRRAAPAPSPARSQPPRRLCGRVQAAVRAHLGDSNAADDISLLMIALASGRCVPRVQPRARVAAMQYRRAFRAETRVDLVDKTRPFLYVVARCYLQSTHVPQKILLDVVSRTNQSITGAAHPGQFSPDARRHFREVFPNGEAIVAQDKRRCPSLRPRRWDAPGHVSAQGLDSAESKLYPNYVTDDMLLNADKDARTGCTTAGTIRPRATAR